MPLTRRGFISAGLAGAAFPALVRAQLLPPPLPGAQAPMPPPLPASPFGTQASPAISPGTRIIWLGASASVPGVTSQLEPDPQGGWVNRATGHRYRQFDTPGPAGAGYVAFDLLGTADGAPLSWATNSLLHLDAGNATSFIDFDGVIARSENLGDYWIPPAKLMAMGQYDSPRFKLMRGPYPLDGRTHEALMVRNQNDAGWTQYAYDLDTGLMLTTSSSTQGVPVLTLSPGSRIVPGAGNTMITYGRLSGIRRTALPGPGEAYPDAVRRYRLFVYEGSSRVEMSGVPPTPLDAKLRYEITGGGANYIAANLVTPGAFGTSSTLARIVPAGVVGSFWMNPRVLGGLSQGQALDRDPITGVLISCLGSDGERVYLALETPLHRIVLGYDLRGGLLMQSETRQVIGPATSITSIALSIAQ